MTEVAVLGLGEAGRIYAVGLAAAGATVRGYDPFTRVEAAGVEQLDTIRDAVAGAEVIVSLVGAAASIDVARDALPHIDRGVYADFNTASPSAKVSIAEAASRKRVRMTDVAVLAPVPRAGVATKLLASGIGAHDFAEAVRPLGADVEAIDAPAGEAARLKLLRSVFMKGLATLVIEGLTAAEAAGAEPWLRSQMAAEFGPSGAALVDRLVSGTFQHAERRLHEMHDALEGLEAGGTPSDMTRASVRWFERILAEGLRPPGGDSGAAPSGLSTI